MPSMESPESRSGVYFSSTVPKKPKIVFTVFDFTGVRWGLPAGAHKLANGQLVALAWRRVLTLACDRRRYPAAVETTRDARQIN